MENRSHRTGNDPIKSFYSAEFQLRQSKLLFQFKLRKSHTEPMFAVVKEGSKALENIKAGDVIDMRYYCVDENKPAVSRPTRIKYIAKDNSVGFKDHYVIGLSFFDHETRVVA